MEVVLFAPDPAGPFVYELLLVDGVVLLTLSPPELLQSLQVYELGSHLPIGSVPSNHFVLVLGSVKEARFAFVSHLEFLGKYYRVVYVGVESVLRPIE